MAETNHILTVSRLAALLKETVEDNFVSVWVEGEVSNLTTASSGHCYFSLKDDRAQIRGVLFRPQARLLRFRPENGLKVLVVGRVSLYPQRGELQLIVETMEPAGVGRLHIAFGQLKTKLEAEGLFSPERKRPLPPYPRTIAVVTSPTGAAIHDILQVLRRRAAGIRVVLCPTRVQGEGAAAEIAEAIGHVNRFGGVDVLIVGRGGGSLEDLWAFNEEAVARAIAASAIPVIAAVGHEVDITIADLVADLRAPTPSAAAELVVRSRLELERHVDQLVLRLGGQLRGRLAQLEEKLAGLRQRLRSPRQQLAMWQRQKTDLERRLAQGVFGALRAAGERLQATSGRLDALSPLRTLARGYAIVFRDQTGETVQDAACLADKDRLRIRFHRGEVLATVTARRPAAPRVKAGKTLTPLGGDGDN